MKILIAALLSAALIWLAPTEQTNINKQVGKAPGVSKHTQAQVIITPQTEQKVELVAVTAPTYTPGSHEDWMDQAGISPSDFGAVDYIVSHESGWCTYKWEGEYGACPAFHGVSDYDGYGLCQSTPPQKMAAAGADWQTNPVTQLKWCSMHAAEKGGWWASYEYWVANQNW